MVLKQLEDLLNTCWKATETERWLLGNPKEVFARLTGRVHNREFDNVVSFKLELVGYFTIHVTLLPTSQICVADAQLLDTSLIAAAEEMGVSYDTPRT